MKKKLTCIFLFSLFAFLSFAQVDSLEYYHTVAVINDAIENIQRDNQRLEVENETLLKRIHNIEAQIQILKKESNSQAEKSATLEASITRNSQTISEKASELGVLIDNTQNDIDEQSNILHNKTIWGLIIAFFVLTISAVITILFHKKGSAQIETLKQQSYKINEEIVSKLSTEMSDMQKISTSIGALSSAGASVDSEQDLIKTLADRITFMEMTLFKMDSEVKGHKQLTRSISQMKDNLRASGYELVDMLGKPYNEGMKAVASFEDDDTLENGARIITKVIKPQINFNGVMIQNAQITVSQNI